MLELHISADCAPRTTRARASAAAPKYKARINTEEFADHRINAIARVEESHF
jgi:hypothetical protein